MNRRADLTQKGFSIIELMIAIVLGALVVAGLVNVLIANRQAYHLQEANNYNQQNMRFAMDRIGWSLRMADFWGGIVPGAITGTPTVTGGAGCTSAWVLAVNYGIYGYDGNTTTTGFPLSGCVPNANYVAGSDVLVVRYVGPDAVPQGAALSAAKIYLRVQTGRRGELFAGASPPTDLPQSVSPDTGTSTYPYSLEMYYLRPCSDLGTASTCSAASDGGNPIPTLMRLRLQDDGTLINEPVVEGVEQLQFEYGVGTPPGNPTPIVYKTADAMAAADWANVVSVRIGYVLRAQTRDTALAHAFNSNATGSPIRLSANCQYTISATGAVTYSTCPNFTGANDPVSGKPQQFTRTQMVSVVQVRNRTRL